MPIYCFFKAYFNSFSFLNKIYNEPFVNYLNGVTKKLGTGISLVSIFSKLLYRSDQSAVFTGDKAPPWVESSGSLKRVN